MEFYPFQPIAANDRSWSENDLNEDPGKVICRLANTTRYVHELKRVIYEISRNL